MKIHFNRIAAVAFAILAFSTLPVRASLQWNFSYTGKTDGITASGTLTTTEKLTAKVGGIDGLSGYEIIGISGTRDGASITGIAPNPNFPGTSVDNYFLVDNALVSSGIDGRLDLNGINFTAGGIVYNLATLYHQGGPNNGPPYAEFDLTTMAQREVDLSITPAFSVTPVPEPSTVVAGALLLLPIGVATVRSLRRNKAV